MKEHEGRSWRIVSSKAKVKSKMGKNLGQNELSAERNIVIAAHAKESSVTLREA